MTQDLVATTKAGLPTTSAELAYWLRFERDPSFGTALNERAVNAPPITEATKAEAARLVKSVEASLEPAPMQLRAKWVARLGMLTASRNESADAIRAKVAAYADMLDQPAWVFNATTLKSAASRFQWFPAFAEVKEFLDGCCARERRFLAMLRKAASAEIPKPKAPPATKAEVEKILRAHDLYTAAPKRKKLGLNYESPLPPAERARIRREIDAKEQARRAKEGVG